jgi:amino acid permease
MTTDKSSGSILESKPRTTSLFLAIFYLLKSAVGLGAVLLVKNFQILGLGYGVPLLIFAAIISSLSLHFLNRVSYNLDLGDYVKICKLAMGRKGEILTIVSLVLVLIGSLIAYAYFIGTYARDSLIFLTDVKDKFWVSEKFLTTILLTVFVLPISCLKDLSKLAITSVVGMALMLSITGLVVFKSLTSDIKTEALSAAATNISPEFVIKIKDFADLEWFPSLGLSALGCFGSLIFAYMNHFTMTSLTQVLKDPTPKRRMTLNLAATGLATAIYLTIAFFSYRYFRNARVSDSLSIPIMTTVFAVAKLAVAVVLILSFPLLADPTRGAIDSLFSIITGDSEGFKNAATVRHYAETVAVVLIPLLVAVSTGIASLAILDIFSSFFGSILVFVLPPLFFLKLKRKYITRPIERGLAYFVLAMGVIIAILGPIAPIADLLKYLKDPPHVFPLRPN